MGAKARCTVTPSLVWPTPKRLKRVVVSAPGTQGSGVREGVGGWLRAGLLGIHKKCRLGAWIPESEVEGDWWLRLLGPGEERGWRLDSSIFVGQDAGLNPGS